MRLSRVKRALLDRRLLAVIALALLAAPSAWAARKSGASGNTLDDGLLEKSWFGPEAAEFREVEDEIDYLWVSQGFGLDGKTVVFATWPEVQFLGREADERDSRDMRLAEDINEDMPEILSDAFRRAFKDRITLGEDKGDIRVEGRIVDCSTGSVAAKAFVGFGAGSGSTTLDLRFVDTASGAVVAGFHHRVVSGTNWSTTDSKLLNWLDDVTLEMARKGIDKLYASGDKVRK